MSCIQFPQPSYFLLYQFFFTYQNRTLLQFQININSSTVQKVEKIFVIYTLLDRFHFNPDLVQPGLFFKHSNSKVYKWNNSFAHNLLPKSQKCSHAKSVRSRKLELLQNVLPILNQKKKIACVVFKLWQCKVGG